MTLTRRRLMAFTAGAAPLVALGTRSHAGATVLLVHDDTLAAGRRFALRAQTLGMPSRALEGDRVRLVRRLLAQRPARIFGMTRHADRLLMADIAREWGYVDLASIQQRVDAEPLSQGCRATAALADAAGPCWPEAFAHSALGGQPSPMAGAPTDPAFSWVLHPKP